MSSNETQIVCRKCKETIDVAGGACPKCGTTIRGTLPYVGAVVLGVLLVLATVVTGGGELLAFGVFGLLVAGSGGFFLYEKRQRMAQANASE